MYRSGQQIIPSAQEYYVASMTALNTAHVGAGLQMWRGAQMEHGIQPEVSNIRTDMRRLVQEAKCVGVYWNAKPPELIGFAAMQGGDIATLVVAAMYRRQGIGSLLLDACVRIADQQKPLTATIPDKLLDAHASRLFERHGFIANPTQPNQFIRPNTPLQ